MDELMGLLAQEYGLRLPRQKDFPPGSPGWLLFSYGVSHQENPRYTCFYSVTHPWSPIDQVSFDTTFVWVETTERKRTPPRATAARLSPKRRPSSKRLTPPRRKRK